MLVAVPMKTLSGREGLVLSLPWPWAGCPPFGSRPCHIASVSQGDPSHGQAILPGMILSLSLLLALRLVTAR